MRGDAQIIFVSYGTGARTFQERWAALERETAENVELGTDVLTRNSLITSPPRAGTTLLNP